MGSAVVVEIERQFARLTPEAQLGLLERLVRRAHAAVSGIGGPWEADLAAMAADPEIRQELARIGAEFSPAEADGLEGH